MFVSDKKENRFLEFMCEHKEEIILVSASISGLIGVILLRKKGLKTRCFMAEENLTTHITTTKSIMEKQRDNSNIIDSSVNFQKSLVKIVDVREHLRNLPEGYHPSIKKMLEAEESGVKLSEHQTLVSAHSRYYAA